MNDAQLNRLKDMNKQLRLARDQGKQAESSYISLRNEYDKLADQLGANTLQLDKNERAQRKSNDTVKKATTILGKILSTLKNVEYGYEPEFLFGLLPKIHKLHKQDWLDIYNTYIVEELFFNLCTGRKVNYKKNEDSYIGHSINSKDIKKKLNIEIRRIDFEGYLKKNKKQLIIKIPDVSKNLTILEKYYPKNKFIITKRNSESISASILKKSWFKRNESLPWIYNNPELFGENIISSMFFTKFSL